MTPLARILPGVLAVLATGTSLALAAPKIEPRRRTVPHRTARDTRAVAKTWHDATPGRSAPLDANGRPMLVLASLNTGERLEIPARSDVGGFDADSLDRAAHLLRDERVGLEHPIEPATLDLVYRAQRKFEAHEIRVVSAYRAPGAPSAPGSSSRGARNVHGKGRAIDLVVPGTSDVDLASWARTLGFVGVGIYPNSGYCHLDVRPASYSWVDTSRPGQRNRESPVQGNLARQSDRDAKKRGVRAIAPFLLPSASVGAIWGTTPSMTTETVDENDPPAEEHADD